MIGVVLACRQVPRSRAIETWDSLSEARSGLSTSVGSLCCGWLRTGESASPH
jgi:hypothetical protein